MAGTATRELENKIIRSPAMSMPSLAATADGALENDYSLAGDVYALVGRDCGWRAGK